MLTGDLDSSLANLASNLDFGNGAKKWDNCFSFWWNDCQWKKNNTKTEKAWPRDASGAHFKIHNNWFLYSMNLKTKPIAGTFYRVGRVVPQWHRFIGTFSLIVIHHLLPPTLCLLTSVHFSCTRLAFTIWTHCCRFRVLLRSLVNKHSLQWWDYPGWSSLVILGFIIKHLIFSASEKVLNWGSGPHEDQTAEQGCRIVESAWQSKFCAWQSA